MNQVKFEDNCINKYKKLEQYTVEELMPNLISRIWIQSINDDKPNEISILSEKKYSFKNSYVDNNGDLKEILLKRSFKNVSKPDNVVSSSEIEYYLAFEYLYDNVSSQKEFYLGNKSHKADIFLNDLNIAIEYDGFFWHKDSKDREKEEKEIYDSNNIYFIRIREYGLPCSKDNYICETSFDDTLKKCIKFINEHSKNKIDVNSINFDSIDQYIEENFNKCSCVFDSDYGNEPLLNYVRLNPDVAIDQDKYDDFVRLVFYFYKYFTDLIFDKIENTDLINRFCKDEKVIAKYGEIQNPLDQSPSEEEIYERFLNYLLYEKHNVKKFVEHISSVIYAMSEKKEIDKKRIKTYLKVLDKHLIDNPGCDMEKELIDLKKDMDKLIKL